MKRRNFIKNTALYSALGVSLPQWLSACTSTAFNEPYVGKQIVVIRLLGGMDGLHVFAPTNNEILQKYRPNLLSLLTKGTHIKEDWYVHPKFNSIIKLIEKDWITILPNVGYPDYNRLSHFKAQDYWETGSVVSDKIQHRTGWLGRLVDENKINIQQNSTPILIVDDQETLLDKGVHSSGIYYKPFDVHANFNSEIAQWIKNHQYLKETELDFFLENVSNNYRVSQLLNTISTNKIDEKDISNKLSVAADCIENHLPFAGYCLTQTGYDTHHKQSIRLEPLAENLFDGLLNFANRLNLSGNWENTTVLVYSEFGRTLKENANGGTDHGTANHVYVLGGDLTRFKQLQNFNLNTIDISGTEYLKHQIDFRDIYTELSKSII